MAGFKRKWWLLNSAEVGVGFTAGWRSNRAEGRVGFAAGLGYEVEEVRWESDV